MENQFLICETMRLIGEKTHTLTFRLLTLNERNIKVNLLSHFYTARAFLPGMLDEGRGTIVTVSSVLGYLGCANLG
jgi:NAD(P)-dependent dehydrogenase (short-subunit alcohol dehydrogenase family)